MPTLLPPNPPISPTNRVMPDATDTYWDSVLAMLHTRIGIPSKHSPRLYMGKSPVFRVGEDSILKLIPPYWTEDAAREVAALQTVPPGGPVATPGVLGLDMVEGWTVLLMRCLPGEILREVWPALGHEERARLALQLGSIAAWLHQLHIPEGSRLAYDWSMRLASEQQSIEAGFAQDNTPAALRASWPAFLQAVGPIPSTGDPLVLLHGDLSAVNLLVEQNAGSWRITGLLDFGDASLGQSIHDWLSPGVHDFRGDRTLLEAFADGYGLPASKRTSAFQARLLAHTILYYGWPFLSRTFPLQQATTWEDVASIVWPLT